jgi:ubiquinone/menaquinone biosynthesis C-methylase UbiE
MHPEPFTLQERVGEARSQRNTRRRALTHDEADPHASEDKEDHRRRHQAFVDWLVDTFGHTTLSSGAGVLDVAGGRGQVAFQLQ